MTQYIAKCRPLEGKPHITLASVYGGSPGKPFMMRIPVTGARPVHISAEGLPDGLSLKDNRVTGICRAGIYTLRITAENTLGAYTKTIRLHIAEDGMLKTPLLGFTTWNAFGSAVAQQDVERTADILVESGLAEVGYSYVNLDSGWQKEYGGKYDAIQPNEKFHDMKGMYDHLHALGLKGGVYSTPMLTAWGCPAGLKSIPGCTRGEPDLRFSDMNGGIGTVHLEENNVRQWTDWGVDYLKYDWYQTEPVNADLMKNALLHSGREIAFCVTVRAYPANWRYWQKNCCSWRDNDDTDDTWANFHKRISTLKSWSHAVVPGHFYDLDMLAIGPMKLFGEKCRLTQNEELSVFTFHSFVPSPVQLSMELDKISDFEFNLIANDEILAVNQDPLCSYPVEIPGFVPCYVLKREMENGNTAVAVINMSEESVHGSIPLSAFGLTDMHAVRSLWEKKDTGRAGEIRIDLEGHAAAVYRIA